MLSTLPSPAFRRVAALAVVAALLLIACDPESGRTSEELANAARAERGLPALPRSAELDSKAQDHADWMAANNRLAHSDLDAGVASWRTLGENVGVGRDAGEVHRDFMSSSAHRSNILGGSYRDFGIGATRAADGRVYIVQVFRG